MLGDLLDQLAADGGSIRKALIVLGVPVELLEVWVKNPTAGTEATAAWFAAQPPDAARPIVLTPGVRAR